MSFLNTTSKITHTSPIPSSVPRAAAVALLQDHEFFLRCDPHYTGHRLLSEESPTDAKFKVPSSSKLKPLAASKVRVYEVTDHLPNPVWSSNVVSVEEFTDLETGIWVRLRSPLGIVVETTWSIEEKKKKGEEGWELVEEANANASRLLMGMVKSQFEQNWRAIHEKIVKRLVEQVEGKVGAEGEKKEGSE